MIPSTRNYPKVSHSYSYTAPYYILCFELIPFWLWEIRLEPFFASGFGKRGHAHSIHKQKMYNILNSPGTSSGLFRQPWSISEESACSPRLPLVWKPQPHPALLIEYRVSGLEGTRRWTLLPPGLAEGTACKSFPPALWAHSPSLRLLSPWEKSI